MIGEVNVNGQRKGSIAWSFFKKLNQKHARCNYCDGIYTYDTTSSHLIKHVRKKHLKAYLQVKEGRDQELKESKKSQEEDSMPILTDKTSKSSLPAVEVNLQTDESQGGEKDGEEENSSNIWKLFARIDDELAECNLCQVKLPCKESVSDLIVHREEKHSGVLLKCSSPQEESSTNGLCDEPAKENGSWTPHSSKDFQQNDMPADEISMSKVDMRYKKSPAWQYYTVVDKTYARCKFCQAQISYVSISNLMRHVIRKHPLELLVRARKEKEKDTKKVADEDSTLESQNPSTISDEEEESEGEICEEVDATEGNASDASSSDKADESPRSKRMKTDNPLVEEEPMMNAEMENVSADKCLPSPQGQNAALEENTVRGRKRALSSTRKGADKGMKKGSSSSVWNYFVHLPNGCFLCKMCGNSMAKSTRISNLWRHMRRVHPSATQKISAEGYSGPIIHALKKDPDTDGFSSGQLAKKKRGGKVVRSTAGGSGFAVSDRATGCLLSERLVQAVEEGNRLLISLQGAVERQGNALERLVVCLEGMNRVQNDKSG